MTHHESTRDQNDTLRSIYVVPRVIKRIEECHFYHSMDLPKHGPVIGDWDLQSGIEKYLGHVDFCGKRVLDVGTASGFLAFWMERKGADVVGFDLSENYSWDRVPFGGNVDPDDLNESAERIQRVNNSFWFAHSLLGSKVKVVYGTAYEIPEAVGQVDLATFGSILLHLRDPFLVLQRTLKLVTEHALSQIRFRILAAFR